VLEAVRDGFKEGGTFDKMVHGMIHARLACQSHMHRPIASASCGGIAADGARQYSFEAARSIPYDSPAILRP
jgi:hypothetical protein